MPNNLSVNDIKPLNLGAFDIKPDNLTAIDIKPNNQFILDQTTVYHVPLGTAIIPAGQWIPFAGFTYPSALTVITGGGVRP